MELRNQNLKKMLPWIELSATSTALIESHSDFLVSL
jgi:hypothetical protein